MSPHSPHLEDSTAGTPRSPESQKEVWNSNYTLVCFNKEREVI